MPNITTTTAAFFIDEAFSKRVQHHTESKLVLWDLIARYDYLVTNSGNKINIPFDTEIIANNKIAGIPVTPSNPTETEVELNLNVYKEASVRIEDIVKFQTHVDVRNTYAKNIGYGVAKAADSSVAALATGFSQNVGTYNTAITTDVLLNGIELLDLADVPEEDRHFVYRSDVKRDLLDISTYTSADFISGKPVESGKLSGALYGVNTSMSNNILKSGNNTSNMLFQRNALAGAMQIKPRTQTEYQLEHLATLMVCDALYGVVELRDAYGIEVRT